MDPNTTTTITQQETTPGIESSFFGISIRAWLAIMSVATVCLSHAAVVIAVLIEAVIHKDFAKVGTYTTVSEPLYTLVIGTSAYYLGAKTK